MPTTQMCLTHLIQIYFIVTCAHYGAHLSPTLHAPARHQTQPDSMTALITFPMSLPLVPSPGVIVSVSCLCVVRVSYFVLFPFIY